MPLSLIERFDKLESLPRSTVTEFNKLFPERPIDYIALGFDLNDEVEIGRIIGPDFVRLLKVDGKEIEHAFNTLSKDERVRAEFETNANLENLLLPEKELELDPFEYKLLQYFRGCQSIYHTQLEIAVKIRKSLRRVRAVIEKMEEKKIISTEYIPKVAKTTIIVNEEWL